MISILEAQGLRNASGGQWTTLADLVMMYCDRTYFLLQGNTAAVSSLDEKVRVGLFQKKDLDPFWTNLQQLVVEKISRQCLAKRPKVSDSQVSICSKFTINLDGKVDTSRST